MYRIENIECWQKYCNMYREGVYHFSPMEGIHVSFNREFAYNETTFISLNYTFLLLYTCKYFIPSLTNLNNVLLFCFINFLHTMKTYKRHIKEIKKKKGKAKYTGYKANFKKRTFKNK